MGWDCSPGVSGPSRTVSVCRRRGQNGTHLAHSGLRQLSLFLLEPPQAPTKLMLVEGGGVGEGLGVGPLNQLYSDSWEDSQCRTVSQVAGSKSVPSLRLTQVSWGMLVHLRC